MAAAATAFQCLHAQSSNLYRSVVSTCSCPSMHLAHPSPPLCFNGFLSFYVPGTSIPTTLFQSVPVILSTRHIHPHHSVSTCSCHSMNPAHPSPPLCFNVFLSFYAPGKSIPTTLFQRVPVLLCTRHIYNNGRNGSFFT